jgi:hypothetical protein
VQRDDVGFAAHDVKRDRQSHVVDFHVANKCSLNTVRTIAILGKTHHGVPNAHRYFPSRIVGVRGRENEQSGSTRTIGRCRSARAGDWPATRWAATATASA